MNLHTLKYIIAVAEEGSFTRAAQKLYVSQPTLSQSIQTLERQMETKLLDRSGVPVRLTPAGEEYIAWARQVVDSELQTMRRIADITNGRSRRLNVGVSPYRSLWILPEVLEQFVRETGGSCTVKLMEQRSSDYFHLLESGQVDLLVDKPQSQDSGYESVTLAEETLLLAVPERLAEQMGIAEKGKKTIPPESLRDQPVILLSESQHMGKTMRGIFDAIGAVPQVVLECQSIEMAYRMVQEGMGIALVPDTLIRFSQARTGVCFYSLENYPLSRTMAVLYPKGRYLSQDARLFIRLLQERMGDKKNL